MEADGQGQDADDDGGNGSQQDGGGSAVLGRPDGRVLLGVQPIRQVFERGVHEFRGQHCRPRDDAQGDPHQGRAHPSQGRGRHDGQQQLGAKTRFGPKCRANPARRIAQPLHKGLIFHAFVRIGIQTRSLSEPFLMARSARAPVKHCLAPPPGPWKITY
jgi:hypothetical protein